VVLPSGAALTAATGGPSLTRKARAVVLAALAALSTLASEAWLRLRRWGRAAARRGVATAGIAEGGSGESTTWELPGKATDVTWRARQTNTQ